MWRLSKWVYLADFLLVPAYVATAIAIAHPDAISWAALFALGVVLWTLTEYWMHRSLFHRFYRLEHGLHHKSPLEWIGVSPFLTGAGFLALWFACVSAFGNLGLGGALFAGFVTGYYAYIVIHVVIHHTQHPIVARLRATHEMHHRGASANFGVSTNFWDRIFRTFKPA